VSENPNAQALARQTWELWRQSMRMARNVLRAERPPQLSAGEAAEHYYAQVPMIAGHIFDRMLSDSAFLKQAPDRDQQERIESVQAIVLELADLNGAVEKDMGPEA
jgi:hypothetical protein